MTTKTIAALVLLLVSLGTLADDIRDAGTHNMEGVWIMYRVTAFDTQREYELACREAGQPGFKCEGGSGYAIWTPISWVEEDPENRYFHCDVYVVRPKGKRLLKNIAVTLEEAAHCTWGDFH